VLKPGTMALIIVLALYGSKLDTTFSKWVVVALLFSVVGDVFLMLEDKWFVHGLASFLMAHLFYIGGFLTYFTLDFTAGLLSATILCIISLVFYFIILPEVKEQGGIPMSIAVAVYILVIAGMVWLSILSGVKILIIAAILFLISDAVLAYDKFKQAFLVSEHMVMFTYFSAQFLFAISIL